MKGYLLDTNILSDVIRDPSGQVAQRIEAIGGKDIYTSLIVAAELRYGVAKRGSAKLRSRVSEILQIIPVLALDQPVDEKYGLIRAELEAAGQPIGMNDLLIAAHAMTLGLTLVTDNTREFSRVSGLEIENWLVR